jgi:hypothetical protein
MVLQWFLLHCVCVFFFWEGFNITTSPPPPKKNTGTHTMEQEPLQYKVFKPCFFFVLGGGGAANWVDIEPSTKATHAHTNWSKNLCSPRNQVVQFFIRRKFLTSACELLTFHLHLSDISSMKCTAHCEP